MNFKENFLIKIPSSYHWNATEESSSVILPSPHTTCSLSSLSYHPFSHSRSLLTWRICNGSNRNIFSIFYDEKTQQQHTLKQGNWIKINKRSISPAWSLKAKLKEDDARQVKAKDEEEKKSLLWLCGIEKVMEI